MPAQWTGEVIKQLHLNGIAAKDLAAEAGLNPKYLSTVLNHEDPPEKARVKIEAALARMLPPTETM